MSTLFVPSPRAATAVLPEDWPSGIVVGSDGRAPSDAALVAACSLAGRSTFGILGVLPTTNSSLTLEELRAALEAQRLRIAESADTWIDVRTGYPPAMLATYAEMHGNSLIVVGLGKPGVIDRLSGDESTLRLARMTQTPLYAVAANAPYSSMY